MQLYCITESCEINNYAYFIMLQGNWQCDIFAFIGVKKKHLTHLRAKCMITKVMNMNEILEQSLLYDFYGELLTAHQKQIYEQFVLEDLSLSEIAETANISRQGVHDIIKRCNKALREYEEKLHLMEKFLTIKRKVYQIEELNDVQSIKKIANEIIEEL